ncbi:helix-turn-helix domain-containing protein [Fundicoccus sp. Sow4_H7]|uniref:helix-turn-helix domain-containing protein n=1 Tax=Fundicoccus sp. Sow4_H7 TaxID=3438784 RepID=UPI003F8DF61C
MIKNNLAVLMAERGYSATDIYNATKISKTTLTSLVNNTGKGVQFDTINTLCKFLKVEPKDFFLYTKYDYEITNFKENDHPQSIHDHRTGEIVSVANFYGLNIYFDDGTIPLSYEYTLVLFNDYQNDYYNMMELSTDDYDSRSYRTLKDFFENSPQIFVTEFMNDLKKYIEDSSEIYSKENSEGILTIFDRTVKLNIKKS